MIEMTKICKIRQLRKAGESVAAIAEQEGVSRDTVYKYIAKDDFSPEVPKSSQFRGSKLDPYRPIIDSWLEEDAQKWRKQRHTARRIWQRLRDEYGAEIAECSVSQESSEEELATITSTINFELETRKERKRTRLINGAKFPALKSFES